MYKVGYIDDSAKTFTNYTYGLLEYDIELICTNEKMSKVQLVNWVLDNQIEAVMIDYKLNPKFEFVGTELIAYLNDKLQPRVEEFAKEMNAKAAEIGCKNTHFITPNGLDAEDEGGVHSTTAEDLAKIMRYCIMTSGEKETFLEVTRTKEYQFQDADRKRTFSCHNHNAFLDMMDGALSGKTGFTAEAGYCYVGSLRRDERTFIVALLACGWPDNKGYKWKDTRRLMEYGLEHYQYRDIDKKMQIPEIKVAGGVDDKKPYQYCLNVPVKIERPAEENSKILMRDGEELRAKLELAKYWNAPLKKGEKIGMLTYYLDGYKVAEYELKNEKAVAKRDFSWCIFWIIKSVML